jgi:hypothetical protein
VDTRSADSAPAALADLAAAGLVSHEMIGDPGRLAGEAEALRVLCGLVAGPVWRIEAFHYAFRAAPGDLAGTLSGRDPEDRAAALEAALQAGLGSDAVWVNATDLLPDGAALDAPLLLLRAHGQAVTGALEAAGPELQAVINARFAAATARLAAGADAAGPLAGRLAAIEAAQAGILAALDSRAGLGDTLGQLAGTLTRVLERLDAQAEVLHAHIGREDMVAGRLAELAALAGAPAAFQETLGLTLAEFLARLERRDEAAPTRVPQFS